MLGMLGLLGALVAGLAADGLIGNLLGKPGDEDNDAAFGDANSVRDDDDTAPEGNLLDWLGLDQDADAEVAGPNVPNTDGPDDPDYVPHSNDGVQAAEPDLTLQGGASDDILAGHGGNDTLAGGDGNDQLTGQDGEDFLQGGAGNDVLYGGADADTLHGGAGNDMLGGEDGDDKLVGGAGADTLLGQTGDDSLYGGAGADTAMGGAGDDLLVGGDADDWLSGGLGDDHLIGDAGSDSLDGGAGNDTLDGRESINAFPEMDFLNGGDGDDTLHLGIGDYANGGAGSDTFTLSDLAPGDPIANITDFDLSGDRLVVVFDPNLHPNPQLSMETPENTDDVIVSLDGVPLAMVQGGAGMSLADVLLTPAQAA